nr:MAG TPA: hypothetical protein [Caudoviricetes sp.]
MLNGYFLFVREKCLHLPRICLQIVYKSYGLHHIQGCRL